jgi:hypothetical protein
MRIFCQKKWIGGRRTHQSRSYFAVQLPHRWWLWGIDIQLDSYIDDPQLRYFEAAVKRMAPGDRVILCTATPSWVDERADPRGFKNLAFLENRLIRPAGARVMLSVSGDSHHYAHYLGDDNTHKVTAGGGGAFLHPTHPLGTKLDLPIGMGDQSQEFTLLASYPSHTASRRTAWGAVGLPVRNPTFMVVPGLMYLLLGWSSQFALRAFGRPGDIDNTARSIGWRDLLVGLGRNPISVLVLVVFLGGLVGFAKPSERWPAKSHMAAKWAMGGVHLVMHVVAVLAIGLLAVRITFWFVDGGLPFTVLLLVLMGALGGFVGSGVTGLYLGACCAWLKAHGNEAYSAMRLTGYKNFLRLHLDGNGLLTVYPIGVRKANTKWVPDPDNSDPSGAYLAPAGDPPVAHLIEDPIVVDCRPGR